MANPHSSTMVGTVPIDQNMRFDIGPPLREAQRPAAACGAKRCAPAFWDLTSKRDTVNQEGMEEVSGQLRTGVVLTDAVIDCAQESCRYCRITPANS
jgi:hypothetical protein